MSNCDWGRPCTCRECRTRYRTEACPSCGFQNVVELEGSGEIKTGRKGLAYADITMPTGDPKELICFKCGYVIQGVEFYTRVSVDSCRSKVQRVEIEKTATPCDGCHEKVEFTTEGYIPVALTEYDGHHYCKKCLPGQVKNNSPDPSSEDEKYVFNNHELKWIIAKVRLKCEVCGKPRWLNYENRWKTKCMACYKKF